MMYVVMYTIHQHAPNIARARAARAAGAGRVGGGGGAADGGGVAAGAGAPDPPGLHCHCRYFWSPVSLLIALDTKKASYSCI